MTLPLLIVGGTGLVGSAIVREAQKTNQYHLMSYSRKLPKPSQQQQNVQYFQGNALQLGSVERAVENNPHIVHTVGTLFEQPGPDGTYERINRDTALTVARAAAERFDGKKPRCMIYFSASSAPPKAFLDERYIVAKRQAEADLLDDEFKGRLRIVIFRPAFIYSYHQRQYLLPLALSMIVSSMILKPLSRREVLLADRPLLDQDVAKAVLETLSDDQVEGVCGIERMRALARAWEKRATLK
ncbi:hypothetical protein EC973_001895 [Apophysomyces ossiformis]|uniref:NAD-dependent epimerase/dehydratase domain-containing protein n=1 Tax=Apophysomyces ossiformis TaxID=679940 RepID=A0A8H7BNM0_9FUNG|nr:hypothetical protein EC973_001895 [Apophysomyces ossiformis]